MTGSLLDGLPGIGPTRKRALIDALRVARGDPRRLARGAAGSAGSAGQDRPRYPRAPPSRRLNRRDRPFPPAQAAQWTGDGRHQARASPFRERTDRCVASAGPRHHHGLLRRRQVHGDERVRGRGLLLRRQSAAGDDPLTCRAVRARGLQGRARRGCIRRARRRLLRGADSGRRRPAGARHHPSRALP